jgi:hypothetical protein
VLVLPCLITKGCVVFKILLIFMLCFPVYAHHETEEVETHLSE